MRRLTNRTLPNHLARAIHKTLMCRVRASQDALQLVGRGMASMHVELGGKILRILETWIQGILEHHRRAHINTAGSIKLARPSFRYRGANSRFF